MSEEAVRVQVEEGAPGGASPTKQPLDKEQAGENHEVREPSRERQW